MALYLDGVFQGSLTGINSFSGSLSNSQSLSGELSNNIGSSPTYTGEYTVTPTEETQTLNTAWHLMTDNVTVNPIPSNYGRISWNGSVLTVS